MEKLNRKAKNLTQVRLTPEEMKLFNQRFEEFQNSVEPGIRVTQNDFIRFKLLAPNQIPTLKK